VPEQVIDFRQCDPASRLQAPRPRGQHRSQVGDVGGGECSIGPVEFQAVATDSSFCALLDPRTLSAERQIRSCASHGYATDVQFISSFFPEAAHSRK
jgi:hypothetical protein